MRYAQEMRELLWRRTIHGVGLGIEAIRGLSLWVLVSVCTYTYIYICMFGFLTNTGDHW